MNLYDQRMALFRIQMKYLIRSMNNDQRRQIDNISLALNQVTESHDRCRGSPDISLSDRLHLSRVRLMIFSIRELHLEFAEINTSPNV